jgi:hypothetical protein
LLRDQFAPIFPLGFRHLSNIRPVVQQWKGGSSAAYTVSATALYNSSASSG